MWRPNFQLRQPVNATIEEILYEAIQSRIFPLEEELEIYPALHEAEGPAECINDLRFEGGPK